MPDFVTMLTGLSTLEISNVKKPATRKRFAITKSEKTMSIDTKVLAVAAEGEAEYVATLKAAGRDAKSVDAAVLVYRLKKNCADLLEPEDFAAVAKAKEDDSTSGGVLTKAFARKDGEDDNAYMSRMNKTLKKLVGDNMNFSLSKKSMDADDEPAADADPRLEQVLKANDALTGLVKGLVQQNKDREFEVEADRDFRHVNRSKAEIVTILKSADSAGAEALKAARDSLTAINQMVKDSPGLVSAGYIVQKGSAKEDAWSKLEALANSVTLKSEDGKMLSKEQKISEVLKTHDGRLLYEQYLHDNPMQRALTDAEQRHMIGLARDA